VQGTVKTLFVDERRRLEVVDWMIKHKANVNAVARDGTGHNISALKCAANLGYSVICEILVKAGADVSWRSDRPATALIVVSLKASNEPATWDVGWQAGAAEAAISERRDGSSTAATWDVKALAITNLLLNAGADPAVVVHGHDALLFAKHNKLPMTAARLQQALASNA